MQVRIEGRNSKTKETKLKAREQRKRGETRIYSVWRSDPCSILPFKARSAEPVPRKLRNRSSKVVMSSRCTSRDNKLSKPKRRHKRTDIIRNTTTKQHGIIGDTVGEDGGTEDGRDKEGKGERRGPHSAETRHDDNGL